eukprot:5107434-Karenia_brevis.AAC.1
MEDGVRRQPQLEADKAHRLPIQAEWAALIPHEKDVEGRVNVGKAAAIQEGDILLLGHITVR